MSRSMAVRAVSERRRPSGTSAPYRLHPSDLAYAFACSFGITTILVSVAGLVF